MDSIILPIKKVYMDKIISGEKRFEYRKKLCKRDIKKIYFYVTAPTSKVLCEVEVIGKLQLLKDDLWHETSEYAGIDRVFFDKYFKNSNLCGAYVLGKSIMVYNTPKKLEEFNIYHVPQGFTYVEELKL